MKIYLKLGRLNKKHRAKLQKIFDSYSTNERTFIRSAILYLREFQCDENQASEKRRITALTQLVKASGWFDIKTKIFLLNKAYKIVQIEVLARELSDPNVIDSLDHNQILIRGPMRRNKSKPTIILKIWKQDGKYYFVNRSDLEKAIEECPRDMEEIKRLMGHGFHYIEDALNGKRLDGWAIQHIETGIVVIKTKIGDFSHLCIAPGENRG